MRHISLITVSLVMAVTLMAGLTGCGDAAGEAKTKAPVILYIQALNDGMPFWSSIFENQEDTIRVVVGNQPIGDDSFTSFYTDVMVKGYEVSYDRKDTGSRIPETFTGNTNAYVPTSGTGEFMAVICRASQKNMPPLRDLCEFGYDSETGLPEIHTACRIVVWGETFAGERVVSKPGTLTVNFTCLWNQ